MPRIDAKKILLQLKNNEINNLYYFYGQNIMGIESAVKAVIKKTVGDYQDFALTKINGKSINISQLTDRIEMLPMLADYNCILINDYNADEQKEEINKSLINLLKKIPSQTVIIFSITSTDIKNGKKSISPKNKKITDCADKNGILCECDIPSRAELIKYIIKTVSKNDCSISQKCAGEIAEYCLSDTLSIKNEIEKLCSYVNKGEITSEVIKLLVYQQSDIDVYKLANAVCRFDRNSAFKALDELFEQRVERGKIIFAVSNAFIDLYRAKTALNNNKQISETASDFSYPREFVVRNAFRDCSGISVKRLRNSLIILRDTAVMLNSTGNNEKIVIEEAVSKMLLLSD